MAEGLPHAEGMKNAAGGLWGTVSPPVGLGQSPGRGPGGAKAPEVLGFYA